MTESQLARQVQDADDFRNLYAKRDADLAPLWATYADEHANQMRNDAGRSRRRLDLAAVALRNEGVPMAAVKDYAQELNTARQRGQSVPLPAFSIEGHARAERDRLRKLEPWAPSLASQAAQAVYQVDRADEEKQAAAAAETKALRDAGKLNDKGKRMIGFTV